MTNDGRGERVRRVKKKVRWTFFPPNALAREGKAGEMLHGWLEPRKQ